MHAPMMPRPGAGRRRRGDMDTACVRTNRSPRQNQNMNGLLLSLAVFAAFTAAVFCTAALLVIGALGAAALLPRGAPRADRLRQFAGEVPRFVWRAIRLLDGLVFVVSIALAVILTLLFS
jgi:hypothetical protein